MESNESTRLVEALARHYDLLSVLADEPCSQLELADAAGVSHSTAHRRVNEFRDLGLARVDGERVALTDLGRRLIDRHETYLADVDRLGRLDAVRERLDDGLSLDAPVFDSAVVEYDDDFAVDSSGYVDQDRFANATRVYGVFDGLMGTYFDIHRSNDEFENLSMILPSGRIETVVETYAEFVSDLLERDVLTVYETDRPIPYTSSVFEMPTGTFVILLNHEPGGSAFHVRNDSDASVEWVRDRYRQYQDDATPVDLSAHDW